MSIASQVL
jgi:hypothetical protein